jgi:hypothetical protein
VRHTPKSYALRGKSKKTIEEGETRGTAMKRKVQVNAMRNPVALTREQERMRQRHKPMVPATAPANLPSHPTEERYYSVAEIAKHWSLSTDTVRKIFAKVPGVLKIGNKGRYVTLRIPARVLQQATARLSACRKQVR